MRASHRVLAFFLVLLLGLGTGGAEIRAFVPELRDERGIPTLAVLLERITPAVVNIAVVSQSRAADNPLFRDPFFRRFFNLPEEPPPHTRMSAGSGVIVDAERGYILTNHHVIENGDEILITLKDRRRFEAELVGSDPATDIALLRIEADNLTALPLGNSDKLKVGDFVVAIGNPFGLGQTVTSGIVSALGRNGLNIEGYEDFIQTDAPINPGNSGGALVTLDGRLVGINTAIVAPSGGNVGIGFAVPSNMARAVMNQLIEHGEVRRGRLGVLIQDLTPDLAEALGTDVLNGAVVTRVESGSPAEEAGLMAGDLVAATARAIARPAEEAGLMAGDLIVEVNGRTVRNAADLRNKIGLTPVGAEVELAILRDGRRMTLRAHLQEAQARADTVFPKLAGADFRDIDPGMPMYGRIEGVLVARVAPGSPAARNGLRDGDIITAVNRIPVISVAQLVATLRRTTGTVALSLVRGDRGMLLVIR